MEPKKVNRIKIKTRERKKQENKNQKSGVSMSGPGFYMYDVKLVAKCRKEKGRSENPETENNDAPENASSTLKSCVQEISDLTTGYNHMNAVNLINDSVRNKKGETPVVRNIEGIEMEGSHVNRVNPTTKDVSWTSYDARALFNVQYEQNIDGCRSNKD